MQNVPFGNALKKETVDMKKETSGVEGGCTEVFNSNTIEKASPLSLNKLLVFVLLSKDSVCIFYMHKHYCKKTPNGILKKILIIWLKFCSGIISKYFFQCPIPHNLAYRSIFCTSFINFGKNYIKWILFWCPVNI